mmetsp:Transcript_32590/g.94379  ORF Transcript_32590/g.94379 Transcript_32590/m.94379 type:complete len:234 (-) Transcript_32590:15-716(-)
MASLLTTETPAVLGNRLPRCLLERRRLMTLPVPRSRQPLRTQTPREEVVVEDRLETESWQPLTLTLATTTRGLKERNETERAIPEPQKTSQIAVRPPYCLLRPSPLPGPQMPAYKSHSPPQTLHSLHSRRPGNQRIGPAQGHYSVRIAWYPLHQHSTQTNEVCPTPAQMEVSAVVSPAVTLLPPRRRHLRPQQLHACHLHRGQRKAWSAAPASPASAASVLSHQRRASWSPSS